MSRRDAFDRILAALNEAAFDNDRWPEVAALVDEAVGTKGNFLTFADGRSPDDVAIHIARFLYRGERHRALEREYFGEYYPRDERIPRLLRLPDSELVRVSDLYTEEELKTSAAYNEVLRRADVQDGLNVRLDGPNGSRITWTAADPIDADGWSSSRIELVRRLLPNLRRYVRTRQVLANVDGLNASLTALLEPA